MSKHIICWNTLRKKYWVITGLLMLLLAGFLCSGCKPEPGTLPPTTDIPAADTTAPETPQATLEATAPATVTVVILATSTPETADTAITIPFSYTVKDGDVLGQIALDYGVEVEALRVANGLEDGDFIQVGQVLIIPQSENVILPTRTPTPAPNREQVIHIVQADETLSGIALKYGVSVQDIRGANRMETDLIQAGQELIIPGETPPATEVTTDLENPDTKPWTPSILEGNLAAAYPLTVERPRYTLHYPPDSLPEAELDTILQKVDTALAQIESTLETHLEGRFDVYVAGTLFGAPDLALRGRSFSSQRKFFFLWDGTGTPEERQYIINHEMTHTFTWNTFGQPASVMLHEGVAVYTGIANMEAAGYIKLEDFCTAYHQAGLLPLPSAGAPFMGHIYDLDNYYSAGCFVKYLIESYGPEKFGQLYTSLDYTGTYEKTLATLQDEWLATLAARTLPEGITPEMLTGSVEAVSSAYDKLFTSFRGTPAQFEAYRALDKARIAMLAGRFDDTQVYLDEFESHF